MSCQRELKELQEDGAETPPLKGGEEKDPKFKKGYVYGWHAGIADALEIVESHEDEGE